MDEYLTVISNSLDSINKQESEILNSSKESPAPNREQLKKDLERFQQSLKEKRDRIAELEQQLRSEKDGNKKLHAILISLKAQLTEKESQIADLRNELNSKNVAIDQLSRRMAALARKSVMQQNVIESQSNVMNAQDAELNRAYYLIASKSKLKDIGLLLSGFLKKNKIEYGNIDKNQFVAIDIRLVTEIPIPVKKSKVKILTQVPEGSYELADDGNGKTVLRIVDPAHFWSVSHYLIIQI